MEGDRPGTQPTFQETQRLTGRWRWVVVGAVVLAVVSLLATAPIDPLTAVVALGVPAGLAAVTLLARLHTTVESDGVRIRFAPFHRRPRVVRFTEVTAVERVSVAALPDYGGVGIRRDHDSWAYLVGSGDALRFVRAGEPDVVVGSDRIKAFHRAVRAARDGDGDGG